MSSEIPEEDLKLAQEANNKFSSASGMIDSMNDHLDVAMAAFSNIGGLNAEALYEYRYIFLNYKNVVKENFNGIMKECVSGMKYLYEPFNTDQQVNDLCSAIEEGLGETKKIIDSFLGIFKNLKDSKDFHSKLIEMIPSIKTSSSQLKQVLDDRVVKYIDKEILAKDWKSFARSNSKEDITDRLPMISKLYKERTEAVSGRK